MIRIKRTAATVLAGATLALTLSAVAGSVAAPAASAASAHAVISASSQNSGTGPNETPWG
jgi:hypothetical protein